MTHSAEHDTSGEDCNCNPAIVPVERDDGSYGWIVIHNDYQETQWQR